MNRALVVTGAAGGIGRAVVLAAATAGWSVGAIDVNASGARRVAEEANSAGAPAAIGLGADVTAEASIAAALDEATSELGCLQAVLANAGIEQNAPLHEQTIEDWRHVVDVNLTGVFLTCKHAIRIFRAHEQGGSIVCTSSPSAFVGFAGGGNSAYGASKGGISAFVRSAAIDYAAAGIRVNALVPGATDTPLLYDGLDGAQRDARAAELALLARQQVPLARLAQPHEIAAAALWLLGEESSYVTGSNLVCDGGLLAKGVNTF